MNFDIEQNFIVTGASSGIGKSTALLLNELGATVVCIARNEDRLKQLKNECKHPDNMHLEIKDLTEDIDNLTNYVKSLKEKYGKFSGMAYCAGISALCPIQMIDCSIIEQVFKTNYTAPILFTKGLLDRRNNIGQGTSIVLISSIDSIARTKGQSIYSGSKAALTASIIAMSKEVSSRGIRMNLISPSMIKTAMTNYGNGYGLDKKDEVSELYPFGWGEPEDVANLAAFLLSNDAKFISGQDYILDSGGMIGG